MFKLNCIFICLNKRCKIIIEIIGPPGVGKSTITQAVLKENNKFISLNHAYVLAVQKALDNQEEFIPLSEDNIKTIATRIFRNLFSLFIKITPKSYEKYLPIIFSRVTGISNRIIADNVCNYPNHISNSAKYLRSYTNDEGHISLILDYIIRRIEIYTLVNKYLENKFILAEEGFIHLTPAIFVPPFPKMDFTDEDIIEYVESIPKPDKIIFLKADPSTCIIRMKNRKRGLDLAYKKLNNYDKIRRLKKEFDCLNVALHYLKSKGVDVYEIDAERNLSELIGKINIHIQ